MRRFAVLLALVAIPLTAFAHESGGGIDVIDVSGPLDASALEFITTSIEQAAEVGQELAVVQINSRAVLDGPAYDDLVDVLQSPPLPIAIWVGPAPAVAFGGVGPLVYSVGQSAISPGSEIGNFNPVVLGEIRDEIISPPEPLRAEESGLELQATIRQYLQTLDGRVFATADGEVEVSTIEDFEGGVTVKQVTFRKPGLGTRFFRLAVSPEAAFFFLVIGLSIVTFEFFALGPGVAAGVAAISLLLAGWGLVTLPTRGWALGLVLAGWILLTAAYQKGGVLFMTVLGTVLLQVGGMFLVDGAGLIDPRWFLVVPSVLAVLFFFLIAMPTVQRARLSTQTIGRESLVGLEGVATSEFDPDGTVEVNSASWMASAHREAGIQPGDAIVVTGVDGLYLEVDPLEANRETYEVD
ncbi:MAG: NfeD family protein [Actinomycetota bacterium]|nr:NfeD family protein [Actinomycetota bacterium]